MFYALNYVEYWPDGNHNSLLHRTVQSGSDLSLEKLCNVRIELTEKKTERNQVIEPMFCQLVDRTLVQK